MTTESYWWKINEGTGTAIEDYGDATDIDATGVRGSWETTGKVWSDIYDCTADGTNDYIETASTCNELGLNTDVDWSLSLWAENSDDTTINDVFGSWYFKKGGLQVYYDASNKVSVRYASDDDDSSGNGRLDILTTSTYSSGTWNNIVLVFDSSERKLSLYVNNSLEVSATFDVGENTAFGDDTFDVLIGNLRYQGSVNTDANALVQDVRIFKTINLDSDERTLIYNGGSGRTTSLSDSEITIIKSGLFFGCNM